MSTTAGILGIIKPILELALKGLSWLKGPDVKVEVVQSESTLTWGVRESDLSADPDLYDLRTNVVVRFENGDVHPHTLSDARVRIRARRFGFWRTIAEASANIVQNSSKKEPMIKMSHGLALPPRGISDYYCFFFVTRLPEGLSSLTRHRVQVRFKLVGAPDVVADFKIYCPQAQRTYSFENVVSGAAESGMVNPFWRDEQK